MTDDVPAQITLYPPETDQEISLWGSLAATLWHAGLVWRDYRFAVFALTPLELRIWCTFTDRRAFDSWRHHKLVRERHADLLATRIDVLETTVTQAMSHVTRCDCGLSKELVLQGHQHELKAVLYCGDCLGYIPNYRLLEWLGDTYGPLQTWAQVSSHVYRIWMLTAALEGWAARELQSPGSALNAAGRRFARGIGERLQRPVWYALFVPSDTRTTACPSCGGACKSATWSEKWFACDRCRLAF